jgi:hypothetical protein
LRFSLVKTYRIVLALAGSEDESFQVDPNDINVQIGHNCP